MGISKFTLDVIAEYVLRKRVGFKKAVELLKPYGVTMKSEPMGLTFWNKEGKRLHGVFNFNQPGEIA